MLALLRVSRSSTPVRNWLQTTILCKAYLISCLKGYSQAHKSLRSCYLHCWHCPAENVFHEATAISSSLVYDMEFHFRNMQNKLSNTILLSSSISMNSVCASLSLYFIPYDGS
ncbi:hypothetical protein WN944_026184 [Citrus x changshan-huyou]|uniref:Uncharacterized protein n=1 Tax=Citrus x changshan-huyou TaxID=2935761 RepID=A0AAP0QEB4_9ROSI